MEQSANILAPKYVTRGPRYTSYPTAPNFVENFDRTSALERWRTAAADLSVYLHIPYCQVLCLFCGCHTFITTNRDRGAPYVDGLLAELELLGQRTDLARSCRQLALGGGTPNFLPFAQMQRLIQALDSCLQFGEDAERSIEIDPRTVDEDYLHGLVDLGFNRISMGVQDLDPDVMRAVNRPQSVTTIETVVRAVRSRGSIPLNMDLIYGLPEQTAATWRTTLERIVGLRPDRLAVYGYAHVPWMKRYHATLDRYDRPDDTLRATLALMARETLEMAGYQRIGFDHFALPDDDLSLAVEAGTLHRNFMGYTTRRGLDLVALGVSGISAVNGTYTQNLKDVEAWTGAIAQGSTPWLRGLLLSVDDELRREIILDLTCNFFLPFEPIERAFGIEARTALAPELGRLEDMERDGLLEIGATGIRVTDLGKPFIRNICMVFDTYLGANDAQRFSRTS